MCPCAKSECRYGICFSILLILLGVSLLGRELARSKTN